MPLAPSGGGLKNCHKCALVCADLPQSCLTRCDPMDHSPPGSTVHGILQTRILDWIAVLSSRGSSRPRDQTFISYVSCIAGGVFTTSTTWEAQVVTFYFCPWGQEIEMPHPPSKASDWPGARTWGMGPNEVNCTSTRAPTSQRARGSVSRRLFVMLADLEEITRLEREGCQSPAPSWPRPLPLSSPSTSPSPDFPVQQWRDLEPRLSWEFGGSKNSSEKVKLVLYSHQVFHHPWAGAGWKEKF